MIKLQLLNRGFAKYRLAKCGVTYIRRSNSNCASNDFLKFESPFDQSGVTIKTMGSTNR